MALISRKRVVVTPRCDARWIYELLTGRTPFESKELLKVGLDEMRRQIREVEPPRTSTWLGAVRCAALIAAAS